MHILVLLTILLCLSLSLPVSIPPAYGSSDKEAQTALQVDIAGQTNPDGLMLSLGGSRRWVRGIDKELDVPSSYLETGLVLGTSPAFGRASLYAEWLAVVFAKVRVQYDRLRFYGRSSSLLSFPSSTASFASADVDDQKGTEEAGNGSRLLIRPTLYAKVGPIIIVNQTDLAYFHFTGKGPYYLEWTYETLLKDGDHVMENRTNVLYEIRKGPGDASLLAGPYYDIMRPSEASLERQCAGIMASWVPWDSVGGLNRPRFYGQIGHYIEDPNRKGENMVAIGMGFDLDL